MVPFTEMQRIERGQVFRGNKKLRVEHVSFRHLCITQEDLFSKELGI